MPRSKKIPLARIMAVRKKLRGLPVKDDAKSKEEALELLAEDMRHTLNKGYSLKDIQAFLVEEQVSISTEKIKKRLKEPGEKGEITPPESVPENEDTSEKGNASPAETVPETLQDTLPKTDENAAVNAEKGNAALPENVPEPVPKTDDNSVPQKPYVYKGFTIKPDTPDEEL